jgi:hypothetical protein
VQLARSRVEREADALSAWRGDTEPVSAETSPWPENSLGDRLLQGTYLGEAQDAPIAEAELAFARADWDDGGPEFSTLDGGRKTSKNWSASGTPAATHWKTWSTPAPWRPPTSCRPG